MESEKLDRYFKKNSLRNSAIHFMSFFQMLSKNKFFSFLLILFFILVLGWRLALIMDSKTFLSNLAFGKKIPIKTEIPRSVISQLNLTNEIVAVNEGVSIQFGNKTPRKVYEISAKTNGKNIFAFDKYEYRLSPNFLLSKQYKNLTEEANLFRNQELQKDIAKEILTTIDEHTGLKAEYNEGKLKGELKIDRPIDFFFEMISLLKKLSQQGKIKLLVRGFADGEKSSWSRKINTMPYDYKEVKYFPVKNGEECRDFNFIYKDTIATMNIENGIYSNEHLPNLRAKYILEEFIIPLIEVNGLKDKVEVGILEGKEYFRSNHIEGLRMVEFIIYYTEENVNAQKIE